MKATGRGCEPTMKASPISPLPSRTNSSWPRSGRSCARSWREASGGTGDALLCSRRKQIKKEATMPTIADKRAAFKKLHESGCFIITNPFDIGSAKALQHLGFKALASTSAGFAWTLGKADNRVTVDDVCDHLAAICAAVDIPVNADFEDGFAHEPDKVGINVARAVKTGVAGLSIEDFTGDNAKPLFDRALAVDRIRAARKAIDADNSGVLLTGRCEAFLRGQKDLALVIDRLTAYAEAGADCLYAPGIATAEEISAVVKAVAPRPVNLLVGAAGPSLKIAGDLGVRRISVGGALARMAWTGFMK